MPRLVRHGLVDSTSERAFAALAAGEARHLDVHVAEAQSAGRGRLGRSWESAPGAGLYASVVLLPPPPGPAPAGLTIAVGLAVRDAVRSLGLVRAGLKWPNDVVVPPEGPATGPAAKLAGILVEARRLERARPAFVVGIGLNVAQERFPATLLRERPVTSLALEGLPVPVEAALERVVAALERRLGELARDPEGLARDYLDATGLSGRPVRVRVGERWYSGFLEGLGIDEGLLLAPRGGPPLRLPLAHVTAVEAL